MAIGWLEKKDKDPKKKLADENRQLFLNIKTGSWAKWRTDSQESYDFRCGDQLTEEEQEDLRKAGMPTFTVDKIGQAIETLKYFITANNPRFYAIGMEQSDADIAAIHSQVIDRCLYLSNFKSVYGRVVDDALSKSLGYFVISVDPDLDRGMGEVIVSSLEPWDVYVDPACSDVLFRDAAFMLVKKNFTRGRLLMMLPEYEKKIKSANGNDERGENYSQRNADTSNSIQQQDLSALVDKEGGLADNIDYYERYEKIRVKFYNVTIKTDPTPRQLEDIKAKVDAEMQKGMEGLKDRVTEQKLTISEAIQKGEMTQERAAFELEKFQKALTDEMMQKRQQLMNDATNQIAKVENKAISEEEYKIFSENPVFKDRIMEAMPYWEARIDVVVSVGDTFLYKYQLPVTDYPIIPVVYEYTGTVYPMSAVRRVVGKQQEINKAHQVMVHNASLGSSLRWKYREGAIDTKKWETQLTVPGGLLPVRGNTEDVKEVLPMTLATAFYEIIQMGEKNIEESIGATSLAQGSNAPANMPYRGLVAMDEFSTRRVRSWMTNIVEPALEHMGKIFTQFAQATYTANKVFRIVNPETGEKKEMVINAPLYNEFGSVIGKFHDYQSVNFDVRIISGSTLPTNRYADREEKMEMFKLGIIDDIAMLQETDIKNKEEIIKRKSMMAQLQGQVASMEEQLKQAKGTIETLERQVVQAGIRGKIQEADVELRKATQDHKTQLATIESKGRADTTLAVGEARLGLKSVEQDAKANAKKSSEKPKKKPTPS